MRLIDNPYSTSKAPAASASACSPLWILCSFAPPVNTGVLEVMVPLVGAAAELPPEEGRIVVVDTAVVVFETRGLVLGARDEVAVALSENKAPDKLYAAAQEARSKPLGQHQVLPEVSLVQK